MPQQLTQPHLQALLVTLLVKSQLLKAHNQELVQILLPTQLLNPPQINTPMVLQMLNHHLKVVVKQTLMVLLDHLLLKPNQTQYLAEHQLETNNHQPQLAQLLLLMLIKVHKLAQL